MKYKLFEEVVLAKDIPSENLKEGDMATIVEYHPVKNGEDGYTLEIFNAFGDTIAVITVPASALRPISEKDILTVRRSEKVIQTRAYLAEEGPEYSTGEND